ncbi:MAG: glycosyltransferase family 39 protein [Planctomycetota bacterium]
MRWIVLLSIALFLRLGVTAVRGFDREPVKDEWSYKEIATNVAAGEGIRFDVTREVDRRPKTITLRSLRPPLYPLALGGVFAVTGPGPIPGRLLSVALGTLSVLCFFGWARNVVGPRAAFFAALALAAWPAHLWSSGEMLTEPLFMALVCAAFWSLSARRILPPGVLLGLAVLTRPSALLLLAPAGLLVLLTPAEGATRRRRLAWLAVTVLALVAPWVIRNAVIHGRPLLTTNMGVTFLGGNSALALTADPPGRWHLPERVLDDDPPPMGYYGWPDLTERENDRRFLALGVDWVRENPGEWTSLLLHKGARFFDPDPRSVKADRRLKAVAGWLSFGPLLLLAILGLPRVFSREMILPLGLIAVQLATALIFYGDARVRLPAVPGFLLLGAAGAGLLLRLRAIRGASGGPASA